MRAVWGVSVAVVTLVVCAPRHLRAQADSAAPSVWSRPVHIDGAIGVSAVTGQWGEAFDVGDYGAVDVAWSVPSASFLWLDGRFTYQSHLARSNTLTVYQATGGGAAIVSGTVNVVAHIPDLLFDRVSPYAIGGGGLYSRAIELDGVTSTGVCIPFVGFCGITGPAANHTRTQNVVGWDAGGGFRIRTGELWLFVEARYTSANTAHGATTSVPIAIGLSF